MSLVATVLIDGPSDLQFDYLVPEAMEVRAEAGARVRVPLGKRSATGTVMRLSGEMPPLPPGVILKPLTGFIAEQPKLPRGLMELTRWLADYYCAPLEQVMRSVLPPAVRAENTAHKSRKMVELAKLPTFEEVEALRRRAPKQAEVLEALRAAGDPVPLASLPPEAVRGLVKKGFAAMKLAILARDPEGDTDYVPTQPLPLSARQQTVLDSVISAVESPADARPLLLFGVTGSGKTEIYLRAVARALELGKTALVLVPEISLTPQTVERFKSRFGARGDQVAVLHSHLNDGERHDEWHRVAQSGARIVIGARSAVFAPLEELGVIIVDEEHEGSYKQDKVPRYHGRDVAVMRATMEKCAVLLGSATPSLESWRNAKLGRYTLLELPERVDGARLPLVRIVDMRTQKTQAAKGAPAILSEPLRIAIDTRLQRQEQVLLFLNRRGYAGAVQCPSCGHVVTCPHCSVSLVYHREEDKLVCHICGYRQLSVRFCPECREPAIRLAGYGTERAEETLRRHFAKARIARIDADTMGRRHLLRETLERFKARQLDVLIGTQMIAKGLHFPGVTLAGVLNADLGLHIPDFRAGERTFQLLTQVAGRSGRGDLAGEVIVQTFSPHVPAVQYARQADFTGFAEQELEMRHALGFPPFVHGLLLTVRSTKEDLAKFALDNLRLRLSKGLPEGIDMGDPAPSPLQRAEDHYRFQLLLRCASTRRMTDHLRAVLARTPLGKDVTLLIDVDPHVLS